MSTVETHPDIELARIIAKYYQYPEKLVMLLWHWGEGDLTGIDGPDVWQMDFLRILGHAIRSRNFNGVDAALKIMMARGSGRQIGKSALVAMLVTIILVAFPHCKITVTANTESQLDKKTWAEIRAWLKKSIVAHWFEVNSSIIYRHGHRETWFAAPITWSLDAPQAFAGQGNLQSANVMIFDEASTIPHKIWEVALAGLTTGLSMFFPFGNCTESTGDFTEAVMGTDGMRWDSAESIDAQECRFPNKEDIAEAIKRHGYDSDYVRVWIRGLPPKSSGLQFIPFSLIQDAKSRPALCLKTDPLILGVDLAWGGDDDNCMRFRKGCDARTVSPIRIPGEQTRDPNVLVTHLSRVLSSPHQTLHGPEKVTWMFMDSAGICGPVGMKLRAMGFTNFTEINFGAHSPDEKYELMRSYMWGQMREALPQLAIDATRELSDDLGAPAYSMTKQVKILLEPKKDIKKRLGRSTDDGDALALTYAAEVVIAEAAVPYETYRALGAGPGGVGGWMR